MPTPYEEISEAYASRDMQKTDANLAQDTLQLGGIDAENYATKDYAKNLVKNKSNQDKSYADGQANQALEESKAYTDESIRNIDYSDFATKADVNTLNNKHKDNVNEINNLKNRVNTNASNITTNAAGIQGNASDINRINQKITNIEGNITNINAEIASIDLTASKVKLSNPNFASTNVNAGMTELFQSVSSGKSQVAAAVTDKGVNTASNASFSQIATNVGRISTLAADTNDANATAGDIRRGKTAYAKGNKITGTMDGGGSGGGTDTSDATATSVDLVLGKTAYARGIKLTGVLVPGTDTSDATAGAGDIADGKTAYVNGYKVTGVATFGTDTSDADATAGDIRVGKTAYVDGVKLTGEARTVSPDAPETLDTSDGTATADDIRYGKVAYSQGNRIVGTNAGSTGQDMSYGHTGGNTSVIEEVTPIYRNEMGEFEYININPSNVSPSPMPVTTIITNGVEQSIASSAGSGDVTGSLFAVTRDMSHYVVVRTVGEDKVFTVCGKRDDALYGIIMGAYKDYKFTDIGIPNDAEITCMTFGAYGYAGYQRSCLLAVGWSTSSKKRISLIHFNAYGSGELMCTTGGSTAYFEKALSNSESDYRWRATNISMAKSNPYIVATLSPYDSWGMGVKQQIFRVYAYTGAVSLVDARDNSYGQGSTSFGFECNDRLLVIRNGNKNIIREWYSTFTIMNTETYTPLTMIDDWGNAYWNNAIFSPDGIYALHKVDHQFSDTNSYKIARVSITDSTVTLTDQGQTACGITMFWNKNAWFSSDNTMFFVYDSGVLKKYQTDLTGGAAFTLVESINVGNNYVIVNNMAGTGFAAMKVTDGKADFWEYLQEVDGTAIIGIMWRGNSYFQLTPDTMTAQPSDVRLGKTFVGTRGIMENGSAIIPSGGE